MTLSVDTVLLASTVESPYRINYADDSITATGAGSTKFPIIAELWISSTGIFKSRVWTPSAGSFVDEQEWWLPATTSPVGAYEARLTVGGTPGGWTTISGDTFLRDVQRLTTTPGSTQEVVTVEIRNSNSTNVLASADYTLTATTT